MKKLNLFGAALLIAASSMIFSCKKDKKDEPMTDDTETIASDESDVQSNEDEISDDVNVAIDANSSISGRYASGGLCQGSVAVDSAARKITITYDGSSCPLSQKTKTGTVIIQLVNGVNWKDQGAKMTVTANLTITKGDKSIVVNGTKTVTNLTGGLLRDLASGLFITHKVKGSFEITFPNSTKRTWNVARRITLKREGLVRFVEISGDTTINGVSGIVMWGTNRRGEEFKNVIELTLKANSGCGWHKPTAGKRRHEGNKTFTATFGLDFSGNPVVSGCASHFKVEWTNLAGENKSAILSY